MSSSFSITFWTVFTLLPNWTMLLPTINHEFVIKCDELCNESVLQLHVGSLFINKQFSTKLWAFHIMIEWVGSWSITRDFCLLLWWNHVISTISGWYSTPNTVHEEWGANYVVSCKITIIKVNLCWPCKCLQGAFLCEECELTCEKNATTPLIKNG